MEDLVARIKKIMTDVSTGQARIQDTNVEYQSLYKQLAEVLRAAAVKNPNPHSDLWEFYTFWSKKLKTYADRRAYVIKIYKSLRPMKPSTKNSAASYVHTSRLSELRGINSVEFDLTRLVRMCDELNIAFASGSYLSVAMLVRAIVDHVPPIFGFSTFAEVEGNYGGGRSFKDSTRNLNTSSRKISDAHLHTPVRRREILPTSTQVDFSNDLDVLLAEIVRILK